jgi:Holliday junction resolvasome RuvABC endonuclease subunit
MLAGKIAAGNMDKQDEMRKQPVIGVTFTAIGLDMSLTSTGVCVKTTGTINIKTIKSDPHKHPNDLERLRFIVEEVMRSIPIMYFPATHMVCIEDYFVPYNPKQIGSAIKLIALGTLMRVRLYEAGIPFFVVSPSQLKKFVLGKGTGQKDLILREVYKRWGINAENNDQADSVVLAYLAESLIMGSKDDMPKFQIEVIDAVMRDQPRYNVHKLQTSD